MYAPAFDFGFKALGHEVVSIDYDDYQYGEGLVNTFFNKVQNRFHFGYKLIAYNHHIIDTATKERPDFIFLYRCYSIWESTIKALQSKGFFVMTYNNDDPFSGIPSKTFYRNFYKNIKLADLNYVYRKKNIADYEGIGAKNVKLLLPYYIEKNNFKEDCPDDIPIAFLGHFENDGRDKYVKAMVDASLPVTVFNGSEWELAPLYDSIKQIVKTGKRGTEYNHTINQCQIALIFLSKLNSDTYTRRCFEIPATQTLMLCEFTDDMNEMFPEDECAVYFRNETELVQKCEYLLAHPDEIKRIALNGYNRLKEIGGSETDRCRQIIETYNSIAVH